MRKAILERHVLGFSYCAAGQADRQPRYHEVEPYGIVFRNGHYYLEAYDVFSRGEAHGTVPQGKVRDFRLQGILDDGMLRILPDRLPPSRRPQKRYHVRYLLRPPAIRHGISRHFADMQIERQPDGSAIVEASPTDPWDAARLLLHYGENCVVLEGDEVLGHMRRMVNGMAKNYGLLAAEQSGPVPAIEHDARDPRPLEDV